MRKFILSAGAALALVALAPADGLAECTGDNRVAHSDADCLSAGWTNNSGGGGSFTHSSTCGWLGTMGILVDYDSGSDYTDSNSGITVTQSSRQGANVENIYCCKDMQDEFCDRVDVLTDEWCASEFGDSPAASTCTADSAVAIATDETCAITASCTDHGETRTSSLAVDMAETDDINACAGSLTLETCP